MITKFKNKGSRKNYYTELHREAAEFHGEKINWLLL